MNEIIFVVEDAPEGGYTARAVGESIFTEAETLDDLHNRVRDAVRCHFDENNAPSSSVCTSCETKSSLHEVTPRSLWH